MGEDVGRYGGCFAVSLGLLDEFGPERIRDTPLSESAFVGAGIGAALGGMRPIVEIMTVNFSLLALDQIMNNAATLLHMSGGQCNVPLVIRMTTGGGRQVAAQHSHSLEGWYAHIPGLRILTPATVEDARGMLWPALEDPDPVLIFEHASLYNTSAELGRRRRARSTSARAAVRRPGSDVTLITYGGTLPIALAAAETLAAARHRRRGHRPAHAAAARRRDDHRLGPAHASRGDRRRGLAERVDLGRDRARIMEQAFYDLDAPVARVCSAEVPMPYAQASRRRRRCRRRRGRRGDGAARVSVAEPRVFRMPSLGADMTEAPCSSGSCSRATACTAAIWWRSSRPTRPTSRSRSSTTA